MSNLLVVTLVVVSSVSGPDQFTGPKLDVGRTLKLDDGSGVILDSDGASDFSGGVVQLIFAVVGDGEGLLGLRVGRVYIIEGLDGNGSVTKIGTHGTGIIVSGGTFVSDVGSSVTVDIGWDAILDVNGLGGLSDITGGISGGVVDGPGSDNVKIDGGSGGTAKLDGGGQGTFKVGVNHVTDTDTLVGVATKEGHGDVVVGTDLILVGSEDSVQILGGRSAHSDGGGFVIPDEESNNKLFGFVSGTIHGIVLDDLGGVDLLGAKQHFLGISFGESLLFS